MLRSEEDGGFDDVCFWFVLLRMGSPISFERLVWEFLEFLFGIFSLSSGMRANSHLSFMISYFSDLNITNIILLLHRNPHKPREVTLQVHN